MTYNANDIREDEFLSANGVGDSGRNLEKQKIRRKQYINSINETEKKGNKPKDCFSTTNRTIEAP